MASARAPEGVADADRLVVAHVADGPLVLRQRAEAEVGPHLELVRVRREDAGRGRAVAGVGEDLTRDRHDLGLFDRGRVSPAGGDAPVDEDDVAVERDLDTHEGLGVAGHGERHDALGDGVGQPVGVPDADGLGR